jgi:hypothetical protein
MEDQLARKTYIAIHTYMSDEAKNANVNNSLTKRINKPMLNGKNVGLLINVDA